MAAALRYRTCCPLWLTNSLGIYGSEVKASASNTGDMGSIPGSGRSPGEENGNPLQYSCLENPMDGGAWWATVHGSQRVGHDFTFTFNPKCMTHGVKYIHNAVQPSPPSTPNSFHLAKLKLTSLNNNFHLPLSRPCQPPFYFSSL